MSSQTLILTGVAGYVVLMLAVGLYASRRSHSFTDFVVAGRNMPLWICGVSVFASWFGGGPMMGATAVKSSYGIGWGRCPSGYLASIVADSASA